MQTIQQTKKNARRIIERAYEHSYDMQKFERACSNQWTFGPDEQRGWGAHNRIVKATRALAAIGVVWYRDPDGSIVLLNQKAE